METQGEVKNPLFWAWAAGGTNEATERLSHYELCDAAIKINGVAHECHCEKGHTGFHVTRVQLSRIVIDGFSWSGENVILEMSSDVAAVVFGLRSRIETVHEGIKA